MFAILALRKRLINDPVAAFRLAFGLYFVLLSTKIIFAYDIFFGEQSIPKQAIYLAYQDIILKQLITLPDLLFIILPYIGGLLGIYLSYASVRRLTFTKFNTQLIPLVFFSLWLVLFLFFVRHPLVRSIHIDYLGWLAFLNIFIPSNKKTIPVDIANASWIFFAVEYFFSGIKKLTVYEWNSGKAIDLIFKTEVARFKLSDDLSNVMSLSSPALCYFVIGVELSALFLIWNKQLRIVILLLSIMLHLGILVFLRIQDLTIGLLIFHLFLGLTLISKGGHTESIYKQ
ncbi:MAG: hypothetical protein WA160_05505 [Pseudobdellovibrio sp.]